MEVPKKELLVSPSTSAKPKFSRGERIVTALQLKSKSSRYHRFLTKVSELISKYLDIYVTITVRPRQISADNNFLEHAVGTTSWSVPIGIVMQGPPLAEADFTLQTLAMYRRAYADVKIVYSTWEGISSELAQRIRDLGVDLHLSSPPTSGGDGNIAFQAVSTRIGIEALEAAGVKYVLKTRSDQRIYNPNALAFLMSLTKTFTPQEGQGSRLVSCGVARQNFMYFPSDMLVFGHIADQKKFWNVRDYAFMSCNTEATSLKDRVWTESYLCRNYLAQLGVPVKETFADSTNLMGRYFVTIDRQMLDLFWPKYNYRYLDTFQTYGQHPKEESTFANWLVAYSGAADPAAGNIERRFTPTGAFAATGPMLSLH